MSVPSDGAGARLVVDDDRLAEHLATRLGGGARQQVVGAARAERHDEVDRLGRPGVGVGRGDGGEGGSDEGGAERELHAVSWSDLVI